MSIQHRFERRIQTLCTCVCASVIAVHSIDSLASDEPSAPPPFMLQSVEETYSSEVAKADAAISKAEADAVKARKSAAAVRLKAYKDRLVEVTKSGDFDKALAVRARVDQLEKDPERDGERIRSTVGEPEKPNRPRPKDTVRFGGHTYALINEPATWNVAKRRCEEMGGHLVSIETSAEEKFVKSICERTPTWVGATDEEFEGRWVWCHNQAPVKLSMKLDNDGGSDHWLALYETEWYDGAAGNRYAYLCEWED